jgi:hypothetical protein
MGSAQPERQRNEVVKARGAGLTARVGPAVERPESALD